MSDNKKYYYLKVKDTFFDSEEMKVLESAPNGLIYQNLYLKLCLLSLKSDGALLFKDAIPYNLEMLSTVLRLNIETVKTGIEVLQMYKLVIILDNGTIFMSDIQSLIGRSTSEAERIKSYRAKIKKVNKRCTNVQELYAKCTPEIEIEKEKEIEKEIEKEKQIKHKHGEYNHVLLTDEELKKLNTEWGEQETARMIRILDEGIETKGYKYKNCYLALKTWKRNEKQSFGNKELKVNTRTAFLDLD
jgi:predicted phage replisome organizer